MYKIGSTVRTNKHGHIGTIYNTYTSWEDLKNKTEFWTIDPNNEAKQMDEVEKVINGDRRDNWLKMQEIPFTERQLTENWYSINTIGGGSIYTCESDIDSVINSFN